MDLNGDGMDDLILINTVPDPNPTSGNLSLEIKLPISDKIEISFFDLTGKQVFPALSNIIDSMIYRFDLSNVHQGVFLVKCILGTKAVVVGRLVICR